LISYLERFIADLITREAEIAHVLVELDGDGSEEAPVERLGRPDLTSLVIIWGRKRPSPPGSRQVWVLLRPAPGWLVDVLDESLGLVWRVALAERIRKEPSAIPGLAVTRSESPSWRMPWWRL
jgi:hypothetical protein